MQPLVAISDNSPSNDQHSNSLQLHISIRLR